MGTQSAKSRNSPYIEPGLELSEDEETELLRVSVKVGDIVRLSPLGRKVYKQPGSHRTHFDTAQVIAIHDYSGTVKAKCLGCDYCKAWRNEPRHMSLYPGAVLGPLIISERP